MNEVRAARWLWTYVASVQILAFLVVLAAIALAAAGCSLLKPANIESARIKCVNRPAELPGEYQANTLIAVDLNTGLPLLSTSHRLLAYCKAEGQDPALMPETSEPNIFSALENIPATLGTVVPTAAGVAVGK